MIPILNFSVSGAWLAASMPIEIHCRVSSGEMMASVHSRAAAYSGRVCFLYFSVISASNF